MLYSLLIIRRIFIKGKKFRKKLPKKEIIHLFLDATLEEINIIVDFEGQGLMEFHLQGGSVEISHRKSYTNLDFKLQGILLSDLNSQTIHTKVYLYFYCYKIYLTLQT